MVPIIECGSRAEKMTNKNTSHVEHGVVGTVPYLGGLYNVPYVHLKLSVSLISVLSGCAVLCNTGREL